MHRTEEDQAIINMGDFGWIPPWGVLVLGLILSAIFQEIGIMLAAVILALFTGMFTMPWTE